MNSENQFIKEYSDTEQRIISDEFSRIKSMFAMNFFLFFVCSVCFDSLFLLVNNAKTFCSARFFFFLFSFGGCVMQRNSKNYLLVLLENVCHSFFLYLTRQLVRVDYESR